MGGVLVLLLSHFIPIFSGKSYINTSRTVEKLSDEFVNLQAPRTALGVFRNGSIGLFQVDGVETLSKGAKLYDLADWLIEMNVFHAINLDGGGSSTSVSQGKVIDRPTCHDIPTVCERSVSTITCVLSPS
jgi:N-acetylglucosamine-1-phosphodiester alpha-N-acetylglucosaminidase